MFLQVGSAGTKGLVGLVAASGRLVLLQSVYKVFTRTGRTCCNNNSAKVVASEVEIECYCLWVEHKLGEKFLPELPALRWSVRLPVGLQGCEL